MKILVVDDVAVNRKLLHATLEAEGHTVVSAANGLEALELLEREPVDAVISDILMPRMDGYRLCHELRQKEQFKQLPFVHYTSTYTSPDDRNLSKTVGANAYLTKPVAPAVLLQALADAVGHATAHTSSALRNTDTKFLMKEYSVVLIKKLEEKNRDLEQAMIELRRAHDSLGELNASLEQRVAERTAELQKSNCDLQAALAEVKELSGLLPICAWCKKIKDDADFWHRVEDYISRHTKAEFTHGICPDCLDSQMASLKTPLKA
jgi:CheY-like chemotaxis protein